MDVKRLTNCNLRAVREEMRNIWFTDIRCRIGFLALIFLAVAVRVDSQCNSTETSNGLWNARIAARLFTERGRQAVAKEDLNSAIFHFGHAIQEDPGFSPAYYYRGLTRVKLDDFQGAIADFDVVLRFDPSFVRALNDRGFAQQQMGNLEAANSDFDHAILLGPDSPLPYLNRAKSKLTAGDETSAIRDLIQALAVEPHFTARDASIDLLFYHRGRTECAHMEWNAAIADFSVALERNPANVYAYIARILAEWCKENTGKFARNVNADDN